MKYVSLFSGIEACSEAWVKPLGWEPLAFAEIDPFACHVLAHRHGATRPLRMPDPTAAGLSGAERTERAAAIRAVAKLPHAGAGLVPNVGDMTQQDWSEYKGKAELVVGGPPCQAFSVAGLRQSLSDARGNLSLEYVRAIHAITPLWTVTENVPGWLSTDDNAFGCFLAALVGEDAALLPAGGRWTDAGVAFGPERSAAWRILDAQFFGVAQRRRRVFVLSVRGAGDWRCAEALFPLGQGVPRHPPARRKAGQDVAGTLGARATGGGGNGTDFDLGGGVDRR